MDIAPFVIDYWKRFVTKAVVYDNGSTDGSVEFLKQFDWIEVRHFDTDGMNDIVQMNIKNDCWHESRGKADWVVVCDFDEMIFSQDLEGELTKMRENGGTILFNKWYAFRGDHRPEYESGKLLHELIPTVSEQLINAQHRGFGKLVLFDPNKIETMGYGIGAHVASPKGEVKDYISDRIYTLHIDKGLGIEYSIMKKKLMKDRLSETNKRNGYCVHYQFSEEKMREDYANDVKKSFNFNTLLASEDSKIHGDRKLDLFIGAYNNFTPPVSNDAYKIIVGNSKLDIKTNLEIIECGNPGDTLDEKFYSDFYMLRNLVKCEYNFAEYVGLCHYRKYFNFLDNIPNIDEEFKESGMILGKPIKFVMSIHDQYKKYHNIEDLDIVGDIIHARCPEYYNIYNNFIEKNLMFPYSMFIMKRDDFLDYIKFIGIIMDGYIDTVGEDIKKRIEDNKGKYVKDFSPSDVFEYQYKIGSYLIDILTNIFLFRRVHNVSSYNIVETEEKYDENEISSSYKLAISGKKNSPGSKGNLDIFICTHKDFESPVKSDIYKVIDAKKIEPGLPLKDDFFSEFYQFKYVYDNIPLKKYVGFCHYRRYFNFLDKIPNLDETFKEYDAIVAKLLQHRTSVKQQYANCHNIEDLYIVGGILADKYPEYQRAWHNFINGKTMIPYNMFIMRSDDFRRYIKFIFDILNEYINIVGTDITKRIENNKDRYLKRSYPNNTVDYQYRIGGYLGERLTNVFIMENFKKLKTYPIIVTEDKYKLNNENK
jgi:hypothetical protein